MVTISDAEFVAANVVLKARLLESFLSQREAYKLLVGKLYPSVVYGNLMRIRKDYIALGGAPNDLPPTPSPNEFGEVPPL